MEAIDEEVIDQDLLVGIRLPPLGVLPPRMGALCLFIRTLARVCEQILSQKCLRPPQTAPLPVLFATVRLSSRRAFARVAGISLQYHRAFQVKVEL